MDEMSFGIMFNSNEILSFENFNTLGKEGTNYFRDCMMIKPDPATKEVKILTPTVGPINWKDLFSIKNVSITSNLLQIEVQYGGGCKTHEFILYVDSILIDGDPPILNFTLCHNANGDACKAIVSETLVFNIKPVEGLYSGPSPLQVQINNKNMGIKWYRDNACIIKYRSHTIPDLMVYLEYSRMEKAVSQVFPSMRIIMDPNDNYDKGVTYGKAVVTEMQWLTKNNILKGVKEKTYSRIEQGMKNQRGQFWTQQDSVIPYGAYFSLTRDSTDEWVWGEVMYPNRKSCGSTLEFTLPPEPLNSGSTSIKQTVTTQARAGFSVKAINNTIMIDLDMASESPAKVDILYLNGRLVNRVSVPTHQYSWQIHTQMKSGCGLYQVVLRTNGMIQSRSVLVSE
jgi:hypothetical protein